MAKGFPVTVPWLLSRAASPGHQFSIALVQLRGHRAAISWGNALAAPGESPPRADTDLPSRRKSWRQYASACRDMKTEGVHSSCTLPGFLFLRIVLDIVVFSKT
jgi:hypothetical protein